MKLGIVVRLLEREGVDLNVKPDSTITPQAFSRAVRLPTTDLEDS
jgi:hypothetical protein